MSLKVANVTKPNANDDKAFNKICGINSYLYWGRDFLALRLDVWLTNHPASAPVSCKSLGACKFRDSLGLVAEAFVLQILGKSSLNKSC